MDENFLKSRELDLPVPPDMVGDRLDKVLVARIDGFSRTHLQQLIHGGHCSITRKTRTTVKDPAWRVKPDDTIHLRLPPPTQSRLEGQPIPLDILFEDNDVLVLNKPAGMVVHPAPGHHDHTLVNALLAHCGDSLSGIGGERRPGIVHRLDKDTSGVMVVAKNDIAHRGLGEQFAAHGHDGRMQRHYQAFIWGTPLPAIGTVDAPLARAANNRKKITVSKSNKARHAVTHYKRLASFVDGQVTHLQCQLETGRTHQIRVHMAHIGHPVLGDALYGSGMKSRAKHLSLAQRGALEAMNRQALHASALGFQHPRMATPLYFEAHMPTDMQMLADRMAEF